MAGAADLKKKSATSAGAHNGPLVQRDLLRVKSIVAAKGLQYMTAEIVESGQGGNNHWRELLAGFQYRPKEMKNGEGLVSPGG
jgi:hypothetical protein